MMMTTILLLQAANLNAIYDQLQSERVRRVLHFLDASKSTYCEEE